MMDDLKEIRKELEAIRLELQQLPAINAVTFLKFYEEYTDAKFLGKKVSDIWEIAPPTPP